MIPKTIHYCWFGRGELPPLARKCIASWKHYMPDYEIVRWDEDNFDVNMIPYVSEAYKARRFAFVSDYARFWILYHHGGVYFDTDVEALRSFDPLLDQEAFTGCENPILKPTDRLHVAPGLGIAAVKGHHALKSIMDHYATLEYHDQARNPDGTPVTVVTIVSDYLYGLGMKTTNEVQTVDGITIYPVEYFAARHTTEFKIELTDHSYSIHHYAASWMPRRYRLKLRIKRMLPRWVNVAGERLKAVITGKKK